MLGTLLKYDFRALSRVMVPLQLSVLAAGVIGCFLINFAIRSISGNLLSSSSPSRYSTIQTILEATSTLMGMLILGLVFASIWVTLFLIARHLYKGFMGDEGYLAFTLPVSTGQHLLSKTICGTVWLLVNYLILIAVLVLFSLAGFTTDGLINIDVVKGYGEIFQELASFQGALFVTELLLLGFVGIVSSVLQIYLAIIVGGAIARTHKVLAAIGIYIASYMIVQTVMSLVSFTLLIGFDSLYSSISSENWVLALQPFMLTSLAVTAVLAAAFYFISYRVIESRTNLD